MINTTIGGVPQNHFTIIHTIEQDIDMLDTILVQAFIIQDIFMPNR